MVPKDPPLTYAITVRNRSPVELAPHVVAHKRDDITWIRALRTTKSVLLLAFKMLQKGLSAESGDCVEP